MGIFYSLLCCCSCFAFDHDAPQAARALRPAFVHRQLPSLKGALVGSSGVHTLHDSLIPAALSSDRGAGSDRHLQRRLIFIGDVHGCLLELQALLDACAYDGGRYDHVVYVGDFVAKGPSSIAVLDFIIAQQDRGAASAVRGNHDDKLSRWYAVLSGIVYDNRRRHGHLNDSGEPAPTRAELRAANEAVTEDDIPEDLKMKDAHRDIACDMQASHAKFLEALPYILRVPLSNEKDVAGRAVDTIVPVLDAVKKDKHHKAKKYQRQELRSYTVVHAGIVPTKKLKEQTHWSATHMRKIEDGRATDGKSAAAKAAKKAKKVAKRRQLRFQDVEPAEQSPLLAKPAQGGAAPSQSESENGWWAPIYSDHAEQDGGGVDCVVYGHDASRGLQITSQSAYTRGLDSRCVYGDQLTAMIFDGDSERLVQVDAREAYD